jgi:AraC family transcriptional regulator of adaptative response/methylated-DNA-[protein]-cysteine methyltransferase
MQNAATQPHPRQPPIPRMMSRHASGQDAADYEIVRRAIAHISQAWRSQPQIEAIAEAVGVTPTELHHLFRRWAGITPKAFLQALTLDHARTMLRDSASILDVSYEVGLSGPGRLHDLFVTHEAMSPGEWKARGGGLTISYGFHPSPFGIALVMTTPRGLAGLAFADAGEELSALDDMRGRWPNATYVEDAAATAPVAQRIFDRKLWRPDQPLRVVLIGTDFEVRVWETLMAIPMGRATTYSDIAARINAPKAARAVGAAVGKNPVCFVVPCHRVMGKNGDITGYHWGITRKRAMLGWEAGKTAGL